MAEITARPTPGGDRKLKCPLCLARLAQDVVPDQTCGGCRVRYHVECLKELGGCTTVGCARASTSAATGVSEQAARRRAEIYAAHEARFARRIADRDAAEEDTQRLSKTLTLAGFAGAAGAVALGSLGVDGAWVLGGLLVSFVVSGAGWALRPDDQWPGD